MSKLPTVHILYENPAWLPPLVEGLEREGFTDIRMVELVDGLVDPLQAPAEGIWINLDQPFVSHAWETPPSSWGVKSSTGSRRMVDGSSTDWQRSSLR